MVVAINDRVRVSYSTPMKPGAKDDTVLDRQRVFPAEAFVAGANRLRFRIEPCPVRKKMSPVYVDHVIVVFRQRWR